MKGKWFIMVGSLIALFVTAGFKSNPIVESQQGGLSSWGAFFLLLLLIIIIAVLLILYALRTPKSVKEAGLDYAEHVEEAHAPVEIAEKFEPVQALPEGEVPPELVVEEPAIAAVEPKLEAVPVKPDDLTVVEGIGPKISSILQAAGITTYSQLAAADVNQLRQLMLSANLRLADPGTWPQQASHLAAGEMDKFEALVSNLRGGRVR